MIKKQHQTGKFLVIEGLDGSGKSTQAKLLGQELRKRGHEYYLTREHTREGPAGKLIERIVNRQEELNPTALQLLFVVDRLDHLKREIWPQMEKGRIVISDRYYWSSVAYGARVADRDWFIQVNKYCPESDLTIYLDISPEEAVRRMIEKGRKRTIFENLAQMKNSQKIYYWLLKKYQHKSVKVNGERPPKVIMENIIRELVKNKLI